MAADREERGPPSQPSAQGHPPARERRKNPRTQVPVVATVFKENAKVGDYLVHDLSAGGALLVDGPALPPGTRLCVFLREPCAMPFAVHALSERLEKTPDGQHTTAVRFTQLSVLLEDLIQQTVLRATAQASEPGVLLVHPDLELLLTLAGDVVRLGLRALLAVTPLDVFRRLRVEGAVVQAVAVDWRDHVFARSVAEFASRDFPEVRRVAILGKGLRPASVNPGDVEAIVTVPWTLSELTTALAHVARADPPSVQTPPGAFASQSGPVENAN